MENYMVWSVFRSAWGTIKEHSVLRMENYVGNCVDEENYGYSGYSMEIYVYEEENYVYEEENYVLVRRTLLVPDGNSIERWGLSLYYRKSYEIKACGPYRRLANRTSNKSTLLA